MTDATQSRTNPRERLLQRIQEESTRTAQEVLAGEHASSQALRRLVVLRDVEERLQNAAPKPNTAPWVAFTLGTIALVALLQWLRCGETEFTARLVVAALDFSASGEGDLELPRKPSSVTVGGFESLELPGADGAPAPVTGTPLEVRLLPDAAAKVTIKPVHVVDGTTVGTSFTAPRAVQFRIAGPSIDFQASLLHGVELRFPSGRSVNDYSEAAAVFGRSSVDFGLDVTAESWGRCTVCTPLRIRSVNFVEARRHDGLDAVRQLSSIRRGKLRFTAIGSEHELQSGEAFRLRLSPEEVSEVVSLGVHKDEETFELELRGSADTVEVGSTANPIDLRPTWLEWLRSRHGPALIWASCVWIFGAIAVVQKWSRREFG
jgi:hypothetical protein